MRIRSVAVVVVAALAAGACGSDRDGGDPDDVAAASDPTAAPTPVDDEPDASPTTEGDDLGSLSAVAADGWTVELVGEGTKPDLGLDPDGVPGIAFLFENLPEGYVSYATAADGWTVERVDTLDRVEIGFEDARRITSLALDPAGVPLVAYSDVAGVWLAVLGDDGTWTSTPVAEAGSRPIGQLVSLEVDGAGQPRLAFFEVTGNGPLAGLVAYATPAG